jgi:broad specificity phosphatase PhoE
VNKFWKTEIVEQKIPTPQRYYTSPLTRCLTTANLTFFGLDLLAFHPFVPEVKELLRETVSGHTCNCRGSKAYIHTTFPTYTFEDDTLWEALHGETDADQDIRSKEVLDDIFLSDSSTYISITGRSDEITSLLRG